MKGVVTPTQPRLDAPRALYDVVGRGIKPTNIILTDADREDYVNRLADLGLEGSLVVYAWSF